MNKTPILITIALFLFAAVASVLLWSSFTHETKMADVINAQIAIAACLGAFISTAFVVFSYIATNKAYIEAQRPHLLMQVESLKVKQDDSSDHLIPFSRIHYRNVTTNKFSDLTILLTVATSNRKIELNELFQSDMTMIGLDSRQRNFDPVAEVRSRGLELQQVAEQGIEVRLTVGYTYTFNGKKDNVTAQMYRWDAKREEWSIC